MGIAAKKISFSSTNTTNFSAYDSAKTVTGSLINIYSGSTPEDNFIGPLKIGYTDFNPIGANPFCFVSAIPSTSGSNIHDVYIGSVLAAGTTRLIVYYTYNKLTSEFSYKGFITLSTFPNGAGNYSFRDMKALRYDYITGTVEVNGTGVTGSGTAWTTSRLSAGSRIGFGSTTGSQITNWYEISSLEGNTNLTLTSNAGSISAGTNYIIEDLQIVSVLASSTTTRTGLYTTKGLRPEIFTPGGTNVAAAASADNIRGTYFLADKVIGSQTNDDPIGLVVDDFESWQSQSVYVVDRFTAVTPSQMRVYKYNLRESLTGLASGVSTSAFQISSSVVPVIGVPIINANTTLATTNHGAGKGKKSIYFTAPSRINRIDLSKFYSDSIEFIVDNSIEVPPGSTNTIAATAGLYSITYMPSLDSFAIGTNVGSVDFLTKYYTNLESFDHVIGYDSRQSDQTHGNTNTQPFPNKHATFPFVYCYLDGILYLTRVTTTMAFSQMYAVPVDVDYRFSVSETQSIITPVIETPKANKFYNICVNSANSLGKEPFVVPTEKYVLYYRINGIEDNTGKWVEIDNAGDLSKIPPSNKIQFKIAFKIIGRTFLPNRIYSMSLIYEDDTTDSHYEPSKTKTSSSSKTFAWRQATSWGSNIPNLRVRIYNLKSGNLVLDDTVLASESGIWEYSTNGTSWNAWDNTQDTVGNYIRYRATSLPAGISVRVVLTQ